MMLYVNLLEMLQKIVNESVEIFKRKLLVILQR
jgi:hypothetical protein